jgi:cytochrome c oxidase assembly protein subunit 15
LLALVCLQGAFGAWTVTLRLQPIIVTIHLLLALVLLGMLTWVCARLSPQATVTPLARKLVVPATIGTILLVIQIALGGWVSTNYAALACTDFPLCHGELIPTMDYQHGYSLWRHLGKTASGDYLPFEALTAIHWTHRMFALVVFVFLVGLGIAAHKDAGLRKTARAILLVVVVQCLTGIATVYFNWPLAIAVIHNGGAALLILLLIMLNYKARYAPTTSSLHVV